MNHHSNKIKELRELNNYSQKQLTNYLEISKNDLLKIESNIKNLNVNLLEKLCILYNCTPEYLLGNSNEYAPTKIPKNIDPKIVAKINETMSYINLLNKLEK